LALPVLHPSMFPSPVQPAPDLTPCQGSPQPVSLSKTIPSPAPGSTPSPPRRALQHVTLIRSTASPVASPSRSAPGSHSQPVATAPSTAPFSPLLARPVLHSLAFP